MRLTDGARFAGYTIVRLLGSGAVGAACAPVGNTRATEATDEPLPLAEESLVRVCMQQTVRTRRGCRRDFRDSNRLRPLP
ncbi:hypothetical protein [Mycobacterium deserti]|uniref:Uncharacterized protein n=1 Tax=Mycobacterium deserti TaxID=2978347 RepID=A0ABT2MIA4_9MYCO|nr:hypothetical protein [Mycobacterium deserti]MCT7662015.1 hypothetical protein [Mycobacterium deserti]